MTISIRMTEEQKKIAESYARCEGISLSEAIKRALFDAIEEEYDIAEAEVVSKRVKEGKEKTYSLDEAEKILGL